MLDEEKQRISNYAHRLNDAEGDLSRLGPDERKHLRKLMQKHELELKLKEMEEELGQLSFPLDEVKK